MIRARKKVRSRSSCCRAFSSVFRVDRLRKRHCYPPQKHTHRCNRRNEGPPQKDWHSALLSVHSFKRAYFRFVPAIPARAAPSRRRKKPRRMAGAEQGSNPTDLAAALGPHYAEVRAHRDFAQALVVEFLDAFSFESLGRVDIA